MNGAKWVSPLRGALVAALCALFFLLAMGVTLMGSSVYRGVVAASDENYGQRTALSYVVNQVRRCADLEDGQVLVGRFDGTEALALSEGDYVTLLYVYDGQLCTLYTQSGSGLTAADGDAVLPVDALSFTVSDGLLTITLTQDGSQYATSLMPRCGVDVTGEVAA
ncbi:DUF4860 domain-containing protein [Pseudoflavonifractor phocaeensis]|uniref:DUF4860 domain-containing protein n=1 Tax=Pseudoflavonifractor phocaeensis TaxID=1870988 RepID=UPI00195A5D18|nr:DUF4860 domain-containing protein [Pseudoflavonifractor phocaeensis]MBM6871668.1 DUF4860 domain-containing protein [Pseudoflavonifractor phocaeensis]MBM6939588.1 DUF4860 domain-containing protein [Pseudoflavonifractor phocaeensis]